MFMECILGFYGFFKKEKSILNSRTTAIGGNENLSKHDSLIPDAKQREIIQLLVNVFCWIFKSYSA